MMIPRTTSSDVMRVDGGGGPVSGRYVVLAGSCVVTPMGTPGGGSFNLSPIDESRKLYRMHIASALLGFVLLVTALLDAFLTVVVARRAQRIFHLANYFYRV